MLSVKGCVYIYYVPSDGISWANFLQTKLSEKEYDINSTLVDISKLQDDHVTHDVNVVLVSPDFCSLPSLKALNTLQNNTSLAVLLGLEQSEYIQIICDKDGHSLREWPVFITEANESSVRGLLMEIISLYEEVHKDDVDFEEDPYDFLPDPKPIIQNRNFQEKEKQREEENLQTDYDDPVSRELHVKQSQLEYQSQEDYDVPVSRQLHVKQSRQIEEDEKIDYDVPVSNQLHAILTPHTGTEKHVFLLLDKKPVGKVKIITECNEEIEAVRVQRELYRVSVKDEKLKFKVLEGGYILGNGAINFKSNTDSKSVKTEVAEQTHSSDSSDLDKLRDLLLKQTDPVCMLCRALRLKEETTESLDEFLAQRCKNLPNLRSLQKILINDEQNITGSSSTDQWPTLLHFGAEYNLIKFCKELLNLPRSLESCNIMNNEKEIPFDIAHHKNHTELASMLEQYMEQQWRRNAPGNKDSGIEPDPPVPHRSEYMAMDRETGSKAPEQQPELQRESTYMEMREATKSFSIDDDDGITDEDLFGDDVPEEPPKPHKTIKAYINEPKKTTDDKVGVPHIVIADEDGIDRQKHAEELRQMHMKKSYSESDTSGLECTDLERLAKLGYDISKLNKVSDNQYSDRSHQTPGTLSRSSSEGSEPQYIHKSRSFSCTPSLETDVVQLSNQTPPKKTSFMKKLGGIFQRKNSLADPDSIIHEEKPSKRDKKKGKSKHHDYTDSPRVSDISTSSNEIRLTDGYRGSTSTDNQLLSPELANVDGQENVKEHSEKINKRKLKSQRYPQRRRSKRLVFAEKDNLRIIDLPARSQDQPQDF